MGPLADPADGRGGVTLGGWQTYRTLKFVVDALGLG